MKKRTKFYVLLLAMVLSLTSIVGTAAPVNAAEKKCSHGYTLSGDFGISRHEIAGGVCIECYHGHSKRVVIPRTFKLNGETLETWQISSNRGFHENGVKEIVLPDNSVYVEEYDKEFDEEFGYVAFKGITFYVHKGTPAEKSIKSAKYPYKYLPETSKPQPVKGTTIKRTIRIQNLAKITWKKVKCDKYEIRYSLKKNMKNAKEVNCSKNKTSLVVKKLKKNRKYYVQIRTKSGKKYSAWSKVKVISKR